MGTESSGMKIARRSFLKALGISPVSTLLQEQASGLRGGIANILGSRSVVSCIRDTTTGYETEPQPQNGQANTNAAILTHLLANGIPQHVLDQLQERAKNNVGHLDPDLAANRSFSLSTKFRIQVQRDYQKAIEQTYVQAQRNVVYDTFLAATKIPFNIRYWW